MKVFKIFANIYSLLIIHLFISCGTEQHHLATYRLPTAFLPIDQNKINAGDTMQLSATIPEDISFESIILKVPYNLCFLALNNGKIIAEKNTGIIKNIFPEKVLYEKIPVVQYDTPELYTINKNEISENKIDFLVFGNPTEKHKDSLEIFYSSKKGNAVDAVELNISAPEIFFSRSRLPIIKINSKESFSDTNRILCDFSVIDNKEQHNSISDKAILTGFAKMKIRGSSSKLQPKQSYQFIMFSLDLKKKSYPLLGLPEEYEWVFYGPYTDNSLMRNVVGYRLHNEMENYSPRTRFFHLIINNDYRGIYVLIEKIKRGKNRVNIAGLEKSITNSDSITGGYIIKLDKGKGKVWESPYKSQVDSGWGKWFFYVEPKAKELNEKQENFIKNYITTFEHALVAGKNWQQYIDVLSFIDYLILTEMLKNVDGYRLSAFFSKDRDAKLKAEPMWDLDLSFGLTSYYDGYKTEGLMLEDPASPFWWRKFLKDNVFRKQLKQRWAELRKTTLSDAYIHAIIEEQVQLLKDDVKYNTAKWNAYSERGNWRKYNHPDFETTVSYMKKWVVERNNYLDKIFEE